MKGIVVFIVLLTLAIGSYMNRVDSKGSALVEDKVESSMAAPVKPDIPL